MERNACSGWSPRVQGERWEKFVSTERGYASHLLWKSPRKYQVVGEFKLEPGSFANFVAHGQAHDGGVSRRGVGDLPPSNRGWERRTLYCSSRSAVLSTSA